MAKSGTVISWKKPYGFVETDDGETVYINTSEIDGGRLRVGLTVNFDIEAGKDGKPKGVNVSGPAVLPTGTELSEEEIAADKERMKAQRDAAKKKRTDELDSLWEQVEKASRKNQSAILSRLMKLLEVEKAEEKRADPTQKDGKKGKGPQLYSKGEFIAFYGKTQGLEMWDVAGGKKKGGKAEKKPEKKILKE